MSKDDPNYRVGAFTLREIVEDLLKTRRPRLHRPSRTLPIAPGDEQVHIRRINFKAHVWGLKAGEGLLYGGQKSVSDIQDNALSTLMGLTAAVEVEGTLDDRPVPRFFWVHIPLNNTLWVNVSEPLR